jgi:hypothetical protein
MLMLCVEGKYKGYFKNNTSKFSGENSKITTNIPLSSTLHVKWQAVVVCAKITR